MRYPTGKSAPEREPSAAAIPAPVRAGPPVRPRPPRGLVWRPRLAEALDAGARRAVTLVCAGPGWGKTTLAASWAQARSMTAPTAWLTLDAQHNDPAALWSDVVLALQMAGALPLDEDVTDLGPALRDFPRRFAVATSDVPARTVLVLDDLHAVRDPHVLEQLSALLRDWPDRLRMVLISRTEPAVPLHRLRAAGELAEIRAADLAFGRAETAQLLALGDGRAAGDDAERLVRQTEGWAVGLRLMIDASDQAAGVAAVEDYLIHEVLETLTPQLQTFLQRTSVPDRVCGRLVDALTSQQDGAGTLEQLARAHLFVEREPDGSWYRYHRMFRAAMRHRLVTTRPGATPHVHQIAARWYAREGAALAALGHAVAAGRDWNYVARLVADRGLPLMWSADRAEFFAILGRIPVERLADSPELTVCAAILMHAYGDVEAVPQLVERARQMLGGSPGAAGIERALSVLEMATVLRRRGEMARLVDAATDMLGALGQVPLGQLPELLQYRAMTLLHKGIGLLWTGRLDHAASFLWAAATGGGVAGLPLVQITAFGHLGLLALVRGSLRQADEHVTAALEIAGRVTGELAGCTAPAHLAKALIESERGRDVEAEEALRRGRYALGEAPEMAHGVLAGLVRIRLLIDRNEPSAAVALVTRLRAQVAAHPEATVLARMLRLARSEIDLDVGDAIVVASRYGGDPAPAGLLPAEQVLLAQAVLALRQHVRAEDALGRVREGPDRVSAVAGWILTALAVDAQGRTGRADEALTRALALAEPEQIRRPFRRLAVQRLSALAGRRQWLTDLRGPERDSVLAEIGAELPVVAPSASDHLSEREVDVLRYLPTVLTAAEIAENLNISVNTVKAHMRAIYRKLGAARRREAVAIARKLGYL